MTPDTPARNVLARNVQNQKVRAAHNSIVERYMAMVPAFFSQLQPDQTFLRGLARRVHTSRTNIRSSSGVPVAPIRRVLDAGCGPGYFAPLLDEMGFEPTGCDLSPKMIAQARRDYPEVTFDVADIRDLPYGHGAFDCVISWYSLIYFCREERV